MLLMATVASAQSPSSVVDKVLAALKSRNAVSASYVVTSSQGSSRGTLVMSGKKFRVLASDIKCWYNGTTMWSYSPATDEVNITTPTAADLQMTNPYSVAQNFKSAYIISKGGNPYSVAQNFKSAYIISKGGTGNGTYTIRFTPKKKSNVKHLLVTVSTATWLITKAVIVETSGKQSTIAISNYNRNASATAATFEFNKSQVPAGTDIVDLR